MTPSDGIAVVVESPSSVRNELNLRERARDAAMRIKEQSGKKTGFSPIYKVYKCGWEGCKAELHNLETLQKHVRKVHCKRVDGGDIPCLWSQCGKLNLVHDEISGVEKRVHRPYVFSSEALWEAHMGKQHLETFAWALGDGPSAHPSGMYDFIL